MKKGLHPKYHEATVTCNGCGTTFKTGATVETITVEICSQCHPFYTGKQKLVDVAGRVDRFKARQAAAKGKAKPAKVASRVKRAQPADSNARLKELKAELKSHTVDTKQ